MHQPQQRRSSSALPYATRVIPSFSLYRRSSRSSCDIKRRKRSVNKLPPKPRLWIKKSEFSLKTSRKQTDQLHCNIFCQLETSPRRFCDWNKTFRSRAVSTPKGIIINNLISCHRKYITYGIGSFHFTWKKHSKVFRGQL